MTNIIPRNWINLIHSSRLPLLFPSSSSSSYATREMQKTIARRSSFGVMDGLVVREAMSSWIRLRDGISQKKCKKTWKVFFFKKTFLFKRRVKENWWILYGNPQDGDFFCLALGTTEQQQPQPTTNFCNGEKEGKRREKNGWGDDSSLFGACVQKKKEKDHLE